MFPFPGLPLELKFFSEHFLKFQNSFSELLIPLKTWLVGSYGKFTDSRNAFLFSVIIPKVCGSLAIFNIKHAVTWSREAAINCR